MDILFLLFSFVSTTGSIYSENVLPHSGNAWGVNIFQLNLFTGSIEGEFEGVIFSRSTTSPFKDRTELRKKYIGYIQRNYALRFGTFYTSIGRGFIFNATEEEIARLVRFLYGFEGKVHIGSFDIKALFGKPKSYVFYNLTDSSDIVGGGEMNMGSESRSLGLSFLRVLHPISRGLQKENKTYNMGGIHANLLSDKWSFYLEGDLRWGWNETYFKDSLGSALYLLLEREISWGSLRFETKDIHAFSHPYMLPPTLNHYGITLNNGIDERGVLLGSDFSPLSDVFCTIEYSHTWSTGKGKSTGNGHLEEEYLEIKRSGDPVTLLFSFDHVYFKKTLAAGLPHRLEITPLFGILFKLPLNFGMEIRYQNRYRNTEGVIYRDNDWLFSLSHFPEFDIVLAYERRRGDEAGTWKRVELVWHIDDNVDFSITLGNQKEDLVCSGGICRYEPAFDGIKIKFTSRF